MRQHMRQNQKFEHKIYIIIAILIGLIGIIVWLGDRTLPRVTDAVIHYTPSAPNSIVVRFNKDMDRRSIEEKFYTTPAIEGTFNWQGKELIFTPKELFPYHSTITVHLEAGGIDEDNKTMLTPFKKDFILPPVRIVYTTTVADQKQQLMIQEICPDFFEFHLESSFHTRFEPSAESYSEKKSRVESESQQKFQRGSDPAASDCPEPQPVLGNLIIEHYALASDGKSLYIIGQKQETPTLWNELFRYDIEQKSLQQLTNDQRFLNKAIIVAPDGNYIALSRIEISKTGEYVSRMQFWIARTSNFKFSLLQAGKAQGSTLFFSPDSSFVLYKNDSDNFEIAPLNEDLDKPAEQDETLFIGSYQSAHGFHPIKPIIALTEAAPGDPLAFQNTLQLFFGDGTKQQLPFAEGLIRNPVFTPDGNLLITAFSRVEEQFIDIDSSLPSTVFHLYSYDLEQNHLEQLTNDPDYSDQEPKISPDGKFVIFLRYPSVGQGSIDPEYRELTNELQGAAHEAEVWLLNLETKTLHQLPFTASDFNILPQ